MFDFYCLICTYYVPESLTAVLFEALGPWVSDSVFHSGYLPLLFEAILQCLDALKAPRRRYLGLFIGSLL